MKFVTIGIVVGSLCMVVGDEVPDILEKHNEKRCQHEAADLTHNSILVTGSQQWATHLATTNGCSGQVHDTGNFGENIFACGASSPDSSNPCATATAAVDSWYNEIQFYNQGDEFSPQTGHFTQVVWKATTSVGCARSDYCQGTGDLDSAFNWMFVVCRYDPSGNFAGQFNDQVTAAASTCNGGGTGDPHMSGLKGQKFDFSGVSNSWYALVHDKRVSLNMRVTAPVPGVDLITYITGIGMVLTGNDGENHTVVITVENPENLQPKCPKEEVPCIADGALSVIVDGDKARLGKVSLGGGVSIVAVNLPGECRPFGFERYWLEKSKLSEQIVVDQSRRLFSDVPMEDWILNETKQTNPVECEEYVLKAAADGTLFDLQSEHTSFQITSPELSLRINHGKIHQVAMRDPTDKFDLPDHIAYQMNIIIEDITLDEYPQGILGETVHPTVNEMGDFIMAGPRVIRGEEEDYVVADPLAMGFILRL
ncbi:unnamed protein product [Choristocarpus tenellus]